MLHSLFLIIHVESKLNGEHSLTVVRQAGLVYVMTTPSSGPGSSSGLNVFRTNACSAVGKVLSSCSSLHLCHPYGPHQHGGPANQVQCVPGSYPCQFRPFLLLQIGLKVLSSSNSSCPTVAPFWLSLHKHILQGFLFKAYFFFLH